MLTGGERDGAGGVEGGKGVGGVALRGEDARGKTAVVLGQPLEASLVVRHRSFEASFGERSLKRGGISCGQAT